jgi:hypothetical protein
MKELEFIAFLAFVIWLVCRNIRTQVRASGNPQALKRQLEADFRSLRVRSSNARYAFDGRTAKVVKDDESFKTSNYAIVGMEVTRVAVNDHGEYFLFLRDEARKPFFKHIEQSRAKLLLGARYVAPQPGSAG